MNKRKLLVFPLVVVLIVNMFFMTSFSISNAAKAPVLKGMANEQCVIDGINFNTFKRWSEAAGGARVGVDITIYNPVNRNTIINKFTIPNEVSADGTTYKVTYMDAGLQGIKNIKEIDASNCMYLKDISVYGASSSDRGILEKVTLPNSDQLLSFNFACNILTKPVVIPPNAKPKIKKIIYDSNNVSGSADYSNLPDLTNLQVEDNQLTSINVENDNKLLTVQVDNNKLTSFKPYSNVNLSLNIENNNLGKNSGTLDLSACPNLMQVKLKNNSISSIDFSANTNVEWIDLENNNLSSIDLSAQYNGSNFPKLTTLITRNNPILYSDFTPSRSILVNKFGESNIGGYQVLPNVYKIFYMANGGSGTMIESDVTENTRFTLPNNTFTRTNYTFSSWNTNSSGNGTSYANGYTFNSYNLNANLTLYAIWTPAAVPAKTFKISYQSNGGSGSMSSSTVTENTRFTLPNNTFTRTNYTFSSWNTNSSGNGTSYANGYTFNSYNLNANLTLYAIWTPASAPAKTFKISYQSNGGSGSMSSSTVTENTRFTLPNNTFTRTNYTFSSWNTNSSGNGTSYANGYTFNSYNLNANLTLYAIWTPVNPNPDPIPSNPTPPATTGKVLKLVKMAAPKITVKKGKAVLKIVRPKDYAKISGYVLMFRTKTGKKFSKFKTYTFKKATSTITIKGLKKGARIQVKIRSFGYYVNEKNKKVKVYSAFSALRLSGKIK